MAPTPPGLPTRFPCWCRAIYSWGGESKNDLGFVEGDLIECLNAGDGSWWMGRLKRDRRMVGIFPSNFVTVLDDSFRPASRASSPMPERGPSPNPPPQKAKNKTFRRPFQSYAAPDLAAEERAEQRRQEEVRARSRQGSPCPPSGRISRAESPAFNNGYPRGVSPAPSFGYGAQSRGPSRGPSPMHFQGQKGDSYPPPPPPHRTTYRPHTSQDTPHGSYSSHHQESRPTTPNPPPSPDGGSGMTPSPLRNAMDDVMTSLEDMGASRGSSTPDAPLDPWSPEAFDQTYAKTATRGGPLRPKTSMGIADQGSHRGSPKGSPFSSFNSRHGNEDRPQSALTRDHPPVLSNYVERMESRLRRSQMQNPASGRRDENTPPTVPLKMHAYGERPKNVTHNTLPPRSKSSMDERPPLKHRKSAFEVGRQMLGRTFTTKSTSTNASSTVQSTTTNSSSSTQATSRSIMSGSSAGAVSATSAASLAKKKDLQLRAQSAMGTRGDDFSVLSRAQTNYERPQSPLSGVTYHSSHASSQQLLRPKSQAGNYPISTDSGVLGGLVAPKPKKSGFFKKILNSARTGAASARTSIVMGESSRPSTSHKMNKSLPNNSVTGFGNNYGQETPNRETRSDSPVLDWVQFRRDVNRSNSLSQIEREERKERCQLMDHPTIDPVDELYASIDGDEDSNGHPIAEPANFQAANLTLVDKNARFINSLPAMTNPTSLANGYVCRPYRSDVQRLRAIFTWVSEKIIWEDDFEGQIDPRHVIQVRRGSSEEVATLVVELCAAVGIHAEVVRGYLKPPGEILELGVLPHPNHWWNAMVVDGEWRIMDCSLASPSNPRRSQYTSCGNGAAESWWFLARPSEICWTHVPEHYEQQHLCPPISTEVLLALPCACPPFFKVGLEMAEYDTSLVRIEDLELVHIKFFAPADVECVAEVEARAFAKDADGDFFESGEIVKKRALSQAEWVGGRKRYTIKALLPGDEGQGTLKIYAGKRGLMHSIKDIVHPLAFALPILHTGENPPYDFLTRHPTPHAQRHDLYVAQPQCQRLAMNNTFVFAVRQHPSSLEQPEPGPGSSSPVSFARPGSALSITSSVTGSNPSTTNIKKPAKLAIQSPAGKIMRLMRKEASRETTESDGGTWETIIKVGERGVWRGLVLADRSARWCVFAEWTCV